MRVLRKLAKWLLILGFVGILLGFATVAAVWWYYSPQLPEVAVLRDVQLQVPLRVMSRDEKLIASFGEARRSPASIDQIPEQLKQAFLSTEDERFYSHPGVDIQGLLRAVWQLVRSGGEFGSGGSTITMQLARNFFLTPERRIERKIKEILLALKIESELEKDQILELYLNKIFLGNRAYGVAAAAQVYYGKSLSELSLVEAATIAGLPKAPSELNPIQNPERSLERRNYVLSRMLETGAIDQASYETAINTPEAARLHEIPIELEAPYVAEMVRLEVESILGADKALTGGYTVYTTLDSVRQDAANRALRQGLVDYDERHGYRGPEAHFPLTGGEDAASRARLMASATPVGGLEPALVIAIDEQSARLAKADGSELDLPLEGLTWARRYIGADERGPRPSKPGDVLKVGDLVRVRIDAEGKPRLAQIPSVQGALVALSPEDGSIQALVGGFSFSRSKFNRATQSMRQPGSSFKPFVYSSAFEKGFTPASIVNDAPIVFDIPGVEKVWRPQNDNEEFSGPIRLREAMVRSKNLVSIRVLDAIGVRYAKDYIGRFGFPADSLPENLSLALGTASAPPLTLARGYAAFANGGYLVQPYLVERILAPDGTVVFAAKPQRACQLCPERLETLAEGANPGALPVAGETSEAASAEGLAPRVIDERNAYLVSSLLMDVVKRGTGRKAMELGRQDLAGKTGTTNEHRDAWFSGYNLSLVATAWVGFDDFGSLGDGEFGSRAALPIWMDFMKVALEGVPEQVPTLPAGITTARINPKTGLLASAGDAGAMMEVFRIEDMEKLGRSASGGARQDPYEVF